MNDFQMEVQRMRRMIESNREQTLPSFGEDKLIGFSKFVSSYGDAFLKRTGLFRLHAQFHLLRLKQNARLAA